MSAPLAERIRPQTFSDLLGQDHLVGPGAPLERLSHVDPMPSLILWGPPGTGKTSIARILGQGRDFHVLSAVSSGVKDLRTILDQLTLDSRHLSPLLFIDEIHRWNKAQQDALLPEIESGRLTLVGATTENPSFSLVPPLLSRCRIFVLKAHEPVSIFQLLKKAWEDPQRGLGKKWSQNVEELLRFLAELSGSDARWALNSLEFVASFDPLPSVSDIPKVLGSSLLKYEKSGEAHYNHISAFIKCLRDSDPDAALYYLARMLEAGEDPAFLLRRMIIFASEDVGNADPRALELAVSAAAAYERIGEAEGWIPLSQICLYLATSPKSRASYEAYQRAREDVRKTQSLEIPLHLRNAPTRLMKELGYGSQKGGDQGNFPISMKEKTYYYPTEWGFEKMIRERLDWWKKHRR